FKELRTQLENQDEPFQTQSDTELLLVLLAREGPSALSKLRGMFALALWDAQENKLLLARDSFGIKPLYHTTQSGSLAFASEIRPLLAGDWVSAELSPEALFYYLQNGSASPDLPLIAGVQALPAGTWLEWTPTGQRSGKLPPIPLDHQSPTATVQDFRQTLLDSAQIHLTSDVPVGLFLSSGVDSASLLAALRASGQQLPTSLTLSFPGTAWDEAPEASYLASHFGSPHIIRSLDPEQEIIPWFQHHLQNSDLPSIDGFNVYCISKVSREHGFKVALSGLGGDELLGGYPSFHRVPHLVRAGRLLQALPGMQSCLSSVFTLTGSRGQRLAEFFSGPPTSNRAMHTYRCIFPDNVVSTLLKSGESRLQVSTPPACGSNFHPHQ
ncbi:MAG: asparagine synthetase B, partial [Blastochloris sp.]|nr:asparagine synthetase B [Blastochloris sp.]